MFREVSYMSKKRSAGKIKDRSNERGAALVMALLITFLLLIASSSLLLESSLNAQNVTDATTEQQAYNAAESGIQSAINVLRRNTVPNPLLDASKPATDPANRINFTRALRSTTSNLPTDTSTQSRLSRWISYNATCNDRVTMGSSGCTGSSSFSYALSITDPDNTGSSVSYSTTGKIFDNDVTDVTQKTYCATATNPCTSPNRIVIKYYPHSVVDLNVGGGAGATNFGYFKVTISGTGALITGFNRFEIIINMTAPYTATRVIRGWIETNATANTAPKIIFDAQTFTLMGSTMMLDFAWGSPVPNQYILGPPQRVGYEAQMTGSAGGTDNIITGTATSPEPMRLLLTSTGYGPRGSTKQLQAIVRKDLFNGLRGPATLTLVGPPSTVSPATTFTFNPGTSNVVVYSGDDAVSTDIIPPIGTTNGTNLGDVEDSVSGLPPHPFNGTVVGTSSDISAELPDFLSSPAALDALVRSLSTVAASSGRFYASGVTPPNFGNNATGQGITFCDGNVQFTGSGGGIMVVTGILDLHGNFSFNGLIIVTGQGGITRSGGGNGTIQGNVFVAPYVGSRIGDGITPGPSATFLAPQYDLSGGGNSTLQYNSGASANAGIAVSNFVLGVVEK